MHVAGDNKNRHMFAFCMLLVKQDVTKKVVLSMLIVGHTHIDIDQKFSIPALYMRKLARSKPCLATPEKCINEWLNAFGGTSPSPSIEFIHAVRDIKSYFDKSKHLDKIFGGYAGTKRKRAAASKDQGKAKEQDGKDKHEVVETIQVTENGQTMEVPVPHIFQFSMYQGRPTMHYKILSSDEKWMPAKKNEDGSIAWKETPEGDLYWEEDEAGIPLVMEWPEGDPPWDNLDHNWKPTDEQGAVLKALTDAIATCSTDGIGLGWQPEDTVWYNNYKQAIVKVAEFSDAVHKVPYHATLDADRSPSFLMPPWKLPAPNTRRNTAVVMPQLVASNTRQEPITYQSLDGSCRYTTSRRAAERSMQQEREAAGEGGVLCCPVCDTATVDDDHTMVYCAHSRAHPQGQMRCACLPHPATS